MGLTDTFNLFNAAPTEMGRLAYASAVSSVTSSHKTLDATHPEKKKKNREDAISDLAELAELANETIRQSYERFQATYDDVTAFYDDADDRLDYLETQINDQIQDIESRTELLAGANGAAVYQDEQGGFYTVRDGKRMAVIDEEELEA
ncbi:MAG: hypothetical protein AB2799_13085, partial [Candidatus Thiodiazotropha sp.]